MISAPIANEAQEAIAATADIVANGIPQPTTALGKWLQGKKSYIVVCLTIASMALGVYTKTISVETAVITILGALGYGAHRSALNTQTAQIVSAIVATPPPVVINTNTVVPQALLPQAKKSALAEKTNQIHT
jgi:hypothetical protein